MFVEDFVKKDEKVQALCKKHFKNNTDKLRINKVKDTYVINSGYKMPISESLVLTDFTATYSTYSITSGEETNEDISTEYRSMLFHDKDFGTNYMMELISHLKQEKDKKIIDILNDYEKQIDDLLK